MTFGEWLRTKRLELGLTQSELADQLGIGSQTLRKWENSSSVPRPYLLTKIASTLGSFPDELEVFFDPSEVRTVEVKQEEAVDQVGLADPTNIQQVAASQLAIINSYYQSGLEQSQQSFRWSLIWGGVGFAFLLLTVGVLFLHQPSEVAYASGLGGVVVEAFAAIYLYLYKHASDQLAAFRASLEETQRLLLANSMCEKLKGDLEQSTRADIIRLIVNAIVSVQESVSPKKKE